MSNNAIDVSFSERETVFNGEFADVAADGKDGGYYIPEVSSAGILSFTPSQTGMPSVPSANIGGPAGASIQSIERTEGTGAPGTTDTYTVTLTDGRTATFQVRNGANGRDGEDGRQPYPNKETGTWWVWDADTGQYEDTGESYGGGGGTISVEDDGAGNVEITAVPSGWTVTDDGNGNVVIGG